jgi:hypothetical protein
MTSVPVLSDLIVIFLSSIVQITIFLVMPLLHSVSDMSPICALEAYFWPTRVFFNEFARDFDSKQYGRAMAQAVSRRRPTPDTRFQSRPRPRDWEYFGSPQSVPFHQFSTGVLVSP